MGAPTFADLQDVLGRVEAGTRFDALPEDLGSKGRTHVYVFEDVVVKIDLAGVGRTANERAALDRLRATDLPVPRALGEGALADGRPWLAMTRLPGEPPADAVLPVHVMSGSIATQLGSLAAR